MTPPPTLSVLIALAHDAGRAIMSIYASDIATRYKGDLSPVTEADEMAEKVILAGLAKHFPDVPVIAEEQVAAGRVPAVGNRFFLVDPLDGTKEFLSRNGEFTVNIAIIEQGVPVSGVVYAPATRQMFWGERHAGAASALISPDEPCKNHDFGKISVRSVPMDGLIVLASRSHRDAETEAYLAKLHVKSVISAGSSLKFCRVAAGEADLYPRFGRTMEWDTAAGQAVLEAAGGRVISEAGETLGYGKADRGFDNPGFLAIGG